MMNYLPPKLKRKGIQRLNNEKNYYCQTKAHANINPVFLEDHYEIKKVKPDAAIQST
jgi:hypothetical protein